MTAPASEKASAEQLRSRVGGGTRNLKLFTGPLEKGFAVLTREMLFSLNFLFFFFKQKLDC